MVFRHCVIAGACKSGTKFKLPATLEADGIFVASALRVVMVSEIMLVLKHRFLTTYIRHTVRNDLRGKPGTERMGAVEMELAGEGWILRRHDPEGCLTFHSCRGHRRIRTVTGIC